MLSRALDRKEVAIVRRVESFIRKEHRHEGGHDAAHVLAVTGYALRIAREIEEEADPFQVVLGALFHDLGRVGATTGILHGLRGAGAARIYLESVGVSAAVREAVVRIVARHTPTTMIPPETVEERVVYDADALDRLGVMGMLRGLMGKRGSTEAILEDRMQKRLGDYDRIHFDVSRRIGEALHRETLEVVARFQEALDREAQRLSRIPWPVPDGAEMSLPSVPHASRLEGVPDLARALELAGRR